MHLSLLALYGVGGWLVRQGLMPVRVLLSAIGFTFSLVFATQGVVQTLADARRVSASMRRSCPAEPSTLPAGARRIPGQPQTCCCRPSDVMATVHGSPHACSAPASGLLLPKTPAAEACPGCGR